MRALLNDESALRMTAGRSSPETKSRLLFVGQTRRITQYSSNVPATRLFWLFSLLRIGDTQHVGRTVSAVRPVPFLYLQNRLFCATIDMELQLVVHHLKGFVRPS